jgi:hypothetical protein
VVFWYGCVRFWFLFVFCVVCFFGFLLVCLKFVVDDCCYLRVFWGCCGVVLFGLIN